MPAYRRQITTSFSPILDFSALRIMYFHLKLENDSDSEIEYAFGSPDDGAEIEGFLSAWRSHDFDDRPLVGKLWARSSASAELKITVW